MTSLEKIIRDVAETSRKEWVAVAAASIHAFAAPDPETTIEIASEIADRILEESWRRKERWVKDEQERRVKG